MLILYLKFLIVFSINYNNNILDKRYISAVSYNYTYYQKYMLY